MPHVITITGASGSGKTTAIRYFLKAKAEGYIPIQVPKYKTRQPRVREEESDSIFVERIPASCDLVYEQYGVRYGLSSNALMEHLAAGRSPIVVLNDVRAVTDVRNLLGPLVTSVFLFRDRPTIGEYETLAEGRGETNRDDILTRYNKAHATYRIFIENIHVFDRVLLNSWSKHDLRQQVLRLTKAIGRDPRWPLKGNE